jgi:leucyl-tRNA synthetase
MDSAHLFDQGDEDLETQKQLHKTIRIVTEDIEQMKFNTAISQMMIFNNFCMKKGKVHSETAKIFSLILSPFAPHVAEEMYEVLLRKTNTHGISTLAYQTWPVFEELLARDEQIEMAVQVNGKTRDILLVSRDLSEEDFLEQSKKSLKLERYFQPDQYIVVKVVFVPNKICNLIVKEK